MWRGSGWDLRRVRTERPDACPRILLSGTGSSSWHDVPSSEVHLQFGPQRLGVLRVSCLTRASSVEGNNSKPKQWPQVRQTVGSLKLGVGHREREVVPGDRISKGSPLCPEWAARASLVLS